MFFVNDTATTEIYTLSLHDALPICVLPTRDVVESAGRTGDLGAAARGHRTLSTGALTSARTSRSTATQDRKRTRLNSSHANISYAVFCLKHKLINTSRPATPRATSR